MRHRPRTLPALLTQAVLLAIFLIGMVLTGAGVDAGPPTLHILHVTPSADATGVPASGFISIVFDRPVVSLDEVGVAGAMPAATISPSVVGQGRWINTSTWTYQLSHGLLLGTRYQVTPRLGLTAQDGARLTGAQPFGFETVRPAVVSVTPAGGTRYVLPGDAVQVTFNQPMRRAAAEHAFHMMVNGSTVGGSFTWNDKTLATQPNGANAVVPPQAPGSGQSTPPARDAVMTFHPATSLPLGAGVQVTLDAGLPGTGGPLGMITPYSWRYTITGPLTVTGSTPTNSASGADVSQGVRITFAAPASQATIQQAVHVQPRLDYQYVSLDDAGTTLTLSGDFQPSRAYTISIDTRPIGTAGQRLPQPYTLHFVTQPAAPAVQLVSQGQAAMY
ncbi:MAG TPA: Ig-like domain-containing protein, partial [Chloroflexota bacterium]|nr:Ig-like domain-containing protein [Chloroflexota bacterium]